MSSHSQTLPQTDTLSLATRYSLLRGRHLSLEKYWLDRHGKDQTKIHELEDHISILQSLLQQSQRQIHELTEQLRSFQHSSLSSPSSSSSLSSSQSSNTTNTTNNINNNHNNNNNNNNNNNTSTSASSSLIGNNNNNNSSSSSSGIGISSIVPINAITSTASAIANVISSGDISSVTGNNNNNIISNNIGNDNKRLTITTTAPTTTAATTTNTTNITTASIPTTNIVNNSNSTSINTAMTLSNKRSKQLLDITSLRNLNKQALFNKLLHDYLLLCDPYNIRLLYHRIKSPLPSSSSSSSTAISGSSYPSKHSHGGTPHTTLTVNDPHNHDVNAMAGFMHHVHKYRHENGFSCDCSAMYHHISPSSSSSSSSISASSFPSSFSTMSSSTPTTTNANRRKSYMHGGGVDSTHHSSSSSSSSSGHERSYSTSVAITSSKMNITNSVSGSGHSIDDQWSSSGCYGIRMALFRNKLVLYPMPDGSAREMELYTIGGIYMKNHVPFDHCHTLIIACCKDLTLAANGVNPLTVLSYLHGATGPNTNHPMGVADDRLRRVVQNGDIECYQLTVFRDSKKLLNELSERLPNHVWDTQLSMAAFREESKTGDDVDSEILSLLLGSRMWNLGKEDVNSLSTVVLGASEAIDNDSALIRLTSGVVAGITGVVMDPIRGGQKEGMKGFLRGIATGLSGVATKPFTSWRSTSDIVAEESMHNISGIGEINSPTSLTLNNNTLGGTSNNTTLVPIQSLENANQAKDKYDSKENEKENEKEEEANNYFKKNLNDSDRDIEDIHTTASNSDGSHIRQESYDTMSESSMTSDTTTMTGVSEAVTLESLKSQEEEHFKNRVSLTGPVSLQQTVPSKNVNLSSQIVFQHSSDKSTKNENNTTTAATTIMGQKDDNKPQTRGKT